MRADQHREVVATGQAYATRQPNATPAEVTAADELTVHDQTIGIYDDGELTCGCGRAMPCRHCPEETTDA